MISRTPATASTSSGIPARRVALLVETSRGYGRGILLGVAAYARLRGNWTFAHQSLALVERIPEWFHTGQYDGIIARIETMEVAEGLLERGVPVVDVRSRFRLSGLASVDTDPAAAAELAVTHLVDRGVRNFAFCGYDGVDFSEERGERFAAMVSEQHGGAVSMFRVAPTHGSPPANHIEAERQATMQIGDLAEWARSLPKPCGVLCANDVRAHQLLLACAEAGVKVPDELLVVGMDNDDVICNLANPSLTSVAPALDSLGFEAAARLDRMMNGEPVPRTVHLSRPTHVEPRRSTDTFATDDDLVLRALGFIRDHACDGVNVADVIAHLGVSRSTLERRFADVTGRTPKEHLTAERLSHVKRLLLETQFPLSQIASVTGFKTPSHLSVAFKQQTGKTPSSYRA